ncbi:MAG: RDD family protein [Verrucomicrobia bacterium]|nr:RDD family protein [Verrucomicrobiota bacterium]MDA1066443.1 RDD family protein [Verrucomicrobiota bacterium]
MQEPPELPLSAQSISNHVKPTPPWVRLLAGGADVVVCGLLAFAIIMVILIPKYYPGTESIIVEYAEKSSGNFMADKDLAKTLMENPDLRNMLVASQTILFTIFFLYFLISEWRLKGSSLGKLIFRIKVSRYQLDQPLLFRTIFMRAWLKTIFLLLSPWLWITFMLIFLQKDKRTVHDLITGTWVID